MSCNFMSSNFTPCYLVRHFHVRHFQSTPLLPYRISRIHSGIFGIWVRRDPCWRRGECGVVERLGTSPKSQFWSPKMISLGAFFAVFNRQKTRKPWDTGVTIQSQNYIAYKNSVKIIQQEVKVIWQKAPHGGPIPRLGVTPGGRKLCHWIPGVGFPISVP